MKSIPHDYQQAGLLAGLLFVIGTLGVLTCQVVAYFPPLVIALTVLFLGFWGVVWGAAVVPRSIMSRFFFMTYLAPFVVFVDYLLWGRPMVEAHTQLTAFALEDERVMSMAGKIGVLGALGMLTGYQLAKCAYGLYRHYRGEPEAVNTSTLPMLLYPFVLIPLLAWYYVVVPKATILSSTYYEILTTGSGSNLAFAGMAVLIQMIIVILFLDALRTPPGTRDRLFKLVMVLGSVFIIVVVFNLLRGSRTAIGMVLACGALYVLWRSTARGLPPMRLEHKLLLLFGGVVVFLVFFAVGSLRDSAATGVSFERLFFSVIFFYKQGTWMGSLSALLGASSGYLYGDLDLFMGRTYWHYFASLPPSFVTPFIGYVRPMDIQANDPLWWFNLYDNLGHGAYTIGGGHPTLVAFMNLRWFGVYYILIGYGALIASVELWAQRLSPWSLVFYGGFMIAGLHWFWYSDMFFIRSLMGAAACGLIYVVALRLIGQRYA